ncbi:MAG: hypothetical protein H0X13_20525 [Ramlibacter sp.]|nr:hypothetical protein [Ramlibacter sp.]
MKWTTKRGKIEWAWFESRMLVQFSDEVEVAEQLYVLCQWRKKGQVAGEHWKFAVFYQDKRIYAFDIQPGAYHFNDKAGKGRPMYGQGIDGEHEHTWSADGDGYGYAEPLQVQLSTPEINWLVFLKRANIGSTDFFHPDNNEPELI